MVAVAALPVVLPEEPETLPVTFPVRAPKNVVAVTVPPLDDEVPLLKFVAVVAVDALPVTLPVTLPVNGPEKAVELVVPVTAAPVEESVRTSV